MRKGANLYYVLADHLGSTVSVVNPDGSNPRNSFYWSFGGSRLSPASPATDKLYTGQQSDATGLYFYQARWYDSAVGRFVSPDTIVPDAKNPQALNRYSYAQNNPLGYVDPTGHCGLAVVRTVGGTRVMQNDCVGGGSAGKIVRDAGAGAAATALVVSQAENAGKAANEIWTARSASDEAGELSETQPSEIGTQSKAPPSGPPNAEAVAAAAAALAAASQTPQAQSLLQRLGSGPPAQGFKSFDAFKYAVGRAGDGKAWHHIVEQTPANIANFGAEQLQNTLNMLRLPAGAGSIHARVSGYYSSIDFQTTGSWTMRVRDWLATKSLEFQYDFGTQTIQRFLNEAQVGQ